MGGDLSKGSYGRVGEESDRENYYKKACKKDSDVKNFHDNLEADMERLINTLENASPEDGLPVDSLKVLILYLEKLDERLKNLILKNEKDIRKNLKLPALIDQYNQLNEATSKFYNGLSTWVGKVSHNQHLLEVALGYIEPANPPPSKAEYKKCRKKLKEYKTAENLFDKELSDLFDSVCAQHNKIREKLEAEGNESGKKLRCVKVWRKFSNIIFAAAFATVLICSMVAAVMTAPPLAAAIGAALPIGIICECLNYRLKKYEKKIKVECEVIETMQNRTHGGLCELKQIGARVKGLEGIIKLILGSVDLYCEDEANQQVAAEDIRKKLLSVKDPIKNLKDPVECIRDKRQSLKDTVEDTKKQIQSLKGTVEDTKTQNQSLKSIVEDTKKQIQSLKQKMEYLITYVNLCDRKIQDNSLQVVLKIIRCDVSPVGSAVVK